jgi:hypothetical protein
MCSPADEEADQPQHDSDDQDDPEKVHRESEPTEQGKDQQQYQQSNHLLSLRMHEHSARCYGVGLPGVGSEHARISA